MSLNQSRPFDQNQKGDVMESAKYFEMFALTRLELNMRIPGRQNQGEKPTLSLKEEDIKTGLQEIKEMGINCTKIIRNIYSTLNEDSTLVSSFIEVINNQITAEKVLELTKSIVEENRLTCMMITHNMQSALELGNRTLMLDAGGIIMDVSGEERSHMCVQDFLDRFKAGAGKSLCSDRMLLI